jgi:hypothetical protein
MSNDLALIEIPESLGLYFTNRNGEIFSNKRGKIKPMKLEKLGDYRRVRLSVNGEVKRELVHRIVARTFIVKPNLNNSVVNHKNGIKNDNRVENLEWCSHSENLAHAYSELNRTLPNRKLSDSDIIEIKNRLSNGDKQTSIAKDYKVASCTINEIHNNKRYKHI